MMKAALAGTASMKFLNVFEVAFGEEEDEENIPDITPTAAEEEEDLPAEAVSTKGADTEFEQVSTSTVTKCMTHSSVKQPPVKKSHKQSAPSKVPGPFTLRDAKAVFPDKANKASYLHTSVPAEFISQRESGPFMTSATMHIHFVSRARQLDAPTPSSTSHSLQCRFHFGARLWLEL